MPLVGQREAHHSASLDGDCFAPCTLLIPHHAYLPIRAAGPGEYLRWLHVSAQMRVP